MNSKDTNSLKTLSGSEKEVPFQSASLDIWDQKYRLKQKDGTFIDNDIRENLFVPTQSYLG
jgi:ribonucleoside-diphosphate reductase alpha chain